MWKFFIEAIPAHRYIYRMIMQQVNDINHIPNRIVSLVPSQTELLAYLGLQNEIVGITKFCIHPAEWLITKQVVGGTKNIHINRIKNLQPDLIIANREENVKDQIEALSEYFPVWVTDVDSLDQALRMIVDIGALTCRAERAGQLEKQIQNEFKKIQKPLLSPKTAYLIWNDPMMAVGGSTFINDMLCYCGLTNIFAEMSRYPVIDIMQLQSNECELLILSSEPFPFKERHIRHLQAQLPGVKMILADGEFFSWYGSRLLQSPAYFNDFLSGIQ